MHDVGKIAIPDAILGKPGKLTDAEYEVMKTHTVKGAEILNSIPQMRSTNAFSYAVESRGTIMSAGTGRAIRTA